MKKSVVIAYILGLFTALFGIVIAFNRHAIADKFDGVGDRFADGVNELAHQLWSAAVTIPWLLGSMVELGRCWWACVSSLFADIGEGGTYFPWWATVLMACGVVFIAEKSWKLLDRCFPNFAEFLVDNWKMVVGAAFLTITYLPIIIGAKIRGVESEQLLGWMGITLLQAATLYFLYKLPAICRWISKRMEARRARSQIRAC